MKTTRCVHRGIRIDTPPVKIILLENENTPSTKRPKSQSEKERRTATETNIPLLASRGIPSIGKKKMGSNTPIIKIAPNEILSNIAYLLVPSIKILMY